MTNTFVHLHNHSQFSLLDGAASLDQLIERAVQLGMPAIALTDHGVMHGFVKFYEKAKAAGIKPIIGCEVYMARRGRLDRAPGLDENPYHLVLLAKNAQGFANLSKLVSKSHLEGYYYKPRIDRELLAAYGEGLIG
ncbi:MAG TPA: DNA polymerase III subunit alpha, partial [Firmicutes bacterium]|nr:DNA polymerase III subunit alpha [Bacillota bacterium]